MYGQIYNNIKKHVFAFNVLDCFWCFLQCV